MPDPTHRDRAARARAATAAVPGLLSALGIAVVAAALGSFALMVSIALAEAVPGVAGVVLAVLSAVGGVAFAASLGVGALLVFSGARRTLLTRHHLPHRWWLPAARGDLTAPSSKAREPDPT